MNKKVNVKLTLETAEGGGVTIKLDAERIQNFPEVFRQLIDEVDAAPDGGNVEMVIKELVE